MSVQRFALPPPPHAHMLIAMTKLFSGLFGFLLCLLLGILFDQVALGILAGLVLGACFGSRKPKASEDASDA